jgi:hypothetical protein
LTHSSWSNPPPAGLVSRAMHFCKARCGPRGHTRNFCFEPNPSPRPLGSDQAPALEPRRMRPEARRSSGGCESSKSHHFSTIRSIFGSPRRRTRPHARSTVHLERSSALGGNPRRSAEIFSIRLPVRRCLVFFRRGLQQASPGLVPGSRGAPVRCILNARNTCYFFPRRF